MYLSELLLADEFFSNDTVGHIQIDCITSDVGSISAHTLFVLVKGVSYDTKKLLPLIAAKHPAALVTEELPQEHLEDIPVLLVASARRALSFALYRFYGLEAHGMTLIGITGTNGKTTTASMLAHILHENGRRVGRILTGGIYVGEKRITNVFYSMTTPDPTQLYKALRQMKDAACDTVVMEVSSHALALEKVAPLQFSIAIFTNLSEEHLDFHKTMDDYYRAKAKLFLQSDHTIYCADDAYASRVRSDAVLGSTSVGCLHDADVLARAVEDYGLKGCSYLYKTPSFSMLCQLCVVGIYNVYNSMLSLCAAIHLGIAPCHAKRALASFGGVCGRMEQVAARPLVYIDYAHTPEALKNALKSINSSKSIGQKVVLVFGCGGDRDKAKRPLMARIAEQYADEIIVTSDNNRTEHPADILRDILSGFENRPSHRVIYNRQSAIEEALRAAKDSDIVLIAGKGHEQYTIDACGYHLFDERKIIRDVLKAR